MKSYKYKNAEIHIRGEANQEKIKEATVKFMRKVEIQRNRLLKEKNQNGNKSTPRAV